jgi:hypothetical protein
VNIEKQTATHNGVCLTQRRGTELNFENLNRKHAMTDKESSRVRRNSLLQSQLLLNA